MKTTRISGLALLCLLAAACERRTVNSPDLNLSVAGGGGGLTLVFTTQPASTSPGAPLVPPIQVVVQNPAGHIPPGFPADVTIALGTNSSGATLSGTLTVPLTNGVATFPDLAVDQPGTGYTLVASAPHINDATSNAFDITSPAHEGRSLAVGINHACAIAASGGTYCWGQNNVGQLGNGTNVSSVSPSAAAAGMQFTMITTGTNYSCGLTSEGAAWCWGINFAGQLGNGSVTSSTVPVPVSGGHTFVSISAGTDYTCALTSEGIVWCWGLNASAQLGQPSSDFSSVPVQVPDAVRFTSLAAGNNFNCALTAEGTAWCWGANASGQYGNGAAFNNSPTPTQAAGGLTFTSLTAADSHTCGLTSAGEAWCWGGNSEGQLGIGTLSNPVLTPVRVGTSERFSALSARSARTCGVVLDGRLFCWGDNTSGQLGDGTRNRALTPQPVAGAARFAVVHSGFFTTCGITIQGQALCWGQNTLGQVGMGSLSATSTPVPVSGGLSFASVTVGAASCGRGTNGSGYCWGSDLDGLLGTGSGSPGFRNTPTPLASGRTWTELVTGFGHSCGISDGVAYCWGTAGPHLGVGGVSRAPGGEAFVSLALGLQLTCGLTASGSGYCWGSNQQSNLGNGTIFGSVDPVPISGGHIFSAIAAGAFFHACGIAVGGAAWCWGFNNSGQLGIGRAGGPPIGVPTAVLGGHVFSAIGVGQFHTCALESGAAWCWGQNGSGQLGDGTRSQKIIPTAVIGGVTFAAISAGLMHTCGLTPSGVAWCWGSNINGQLGDGTFTNTSAPVAVTGGQVFSSITAGVQHTCGVTTGGTAYCWGNYINGEVGNGLNGPFTPTAVAGGIAFKIED